MTDASPFFGFIGQRQHLPMLHTLIEAAKATGNPLPHMLITGNSGLGKSALARAIARGVNRPLRTFSADNTLSASFIAAKLGSGDLAFIDEAHALTSPAQEALYDLLDAKLYNQQHPEHRIPECSFLIATDQPFRLNRAFKARIPTPLPLHPYSEKELMEIVGMMIHSNGLNSTGQAKRKLAKATQGIPRNARHHVELLVSYAQKANSQTIDVPMVERYLRERGFDGLYRSWQQQEYLRRLLKSSRCRASLDSLATRMHIEKQTIQSEIEPFLLERGWIEITAGGRVLTEMGRTSLPSSVEEAAAEGESS